MVARISDSVADEVCGLLQELQTLGGALAAIHLGRKFFTSPMQIWTVTITVQDEQLTRSERAIDVESFDVAQAVATAVAGRYDCLGKAG